jgi:hypothetical protein
MENKMPNFKTHCAISKKRTGHDFADLHRWIDEPKKKLGFNHRQERHHFNEKDMKLIKDFWNKRKKGLGEKAMVEWLFHIAIDNLDTAFRLSSKDFSYGDKAYNFMQFGIQKSGYIHCDFEYMNDKELYEMMNYDEECEFEYDDEDDGFISGLVKRFF